MAIFLTQVDGKIVALSILGSDVLNLHNVRLASWDINDGHCCDVSDVVVAEDTHAAYSDIFRGNSADHKGDVLSGHVTLFDKAVVCSNLIIISRPRPVFERVFKVCGESRGRCALCVVAPVRVRSDIDIYLSGFKLLEVR